MKNFLRSWMVANIVGLAGVMIGRWLYMVGLARVMIGCPRFCEGKVSYAPKLPPYKKEPKNAQLRQDSLLVRCYSVLSAAACFSAIRCCVGCFVFAAFIFICQLVNTWADIAFTRVVFKHFFDVDA